MLYTCTEYAIIHLPQFSVYNSHTLLFRDRENDGDEETQNIENNSTLKVGRIVFQTRLCLYLL
jgi:hypothetical protein